MTVVQYNVYEGLTACRLAATSNLAGTYFNGPTNNGVGATLTLASGAFVVDSVNVNVGDRILLEAQTAANQNGIYICNSNGGVGLSAVLQRAADQQNIEQLKAGQYVSIAAGTVNQGTIFTLVEPLPARLGIDPLNWPLSPLFLARAVNGLTALAGGAQAGTPLTGQINRVTTVTTAADSVQLPNAVVGAEVTVINAAAANALAIFPQTGQNINALAPNASISLAANKTITFFCAVAGTWNSQLTA